MIDAGLSERKMSHRLRAIGVDPGRLQAIFLTHEHSDHISGVGPISRKYKIPVYSTQGTYRKIEKQCGNLTEWKSIVAEDSLCLGDLTVEPYSTPHDAEESVAFVVRSNGYKLGHATDLGCVTPLVKEKLQGADALLVESNHDLTMLDAGPYPWPLKQRIKSNTGHLSNEACADLLGAVGHSGLQWVVLMHLSQKCNLPELAKMTASEELKPFPAKLILARQDEATPLVPLY